MRLTKLKTATLKIEQASLTGEAVSVMKRLDPNPDEGCELQACEPKRHLAPVPACRAGRIPTCQSSPLTHSPLHLDAQAKECMLFASTTISSGQAVGIVTNIGMDTEIGCASCRRPGPAPPPAPGSTSTESPSIVVLVLPLNPAALPPLPSRKIQASITQAKEEEEDTPLKKKLDEFGAPAAPVPTSSQPFSLSSALPLPLTPH